MSNLSPIPSPALQLMPTQDVINYFTANQESDGTARTYGATLRGFFAWSGKDYRDVTPFDALDYNAYLKASEAASTLQTHIATLNTFFRFCMECGLIEKNPFAVVKQKGATTRAPEKFMVPRESQKLLAALREKAEKRYIAGLLLYATGARISEVQQLSVCDFIEAPSGDMFVSLLRKGGKRQMLPLEPEVWAEAKAFIGRPISQFDKAPLFTNPSGKRISTVSIRSWIEEAAKAAGITKKVTPHWFRHSFATNALDAGADLRDVQWYLNHASLSSTQIYAHPTNKRVGKFIKKVPRESFETLKPQTP